MNNIPLSSVEIIEEKLFIQWLNQILSKRNLRIAKFPDDLCDGSLFGNIYEILTGKSIGKLDKAKFEVQKIANMSVVLKAFEEDGLKINCSSETLVKGNVKSILGFVWIIYRKYPSQDVYFNSVLSYFVKERVAFSADRIGEQEKLSGILQNGIILCALIKYQVPEANEIQLNSLNKEKYVENLNLAFSTAERYLGVKKTLDSQEVADCKVDDERLMNYLMNFIRTGGASRATVRLAPLKVEKSTAQKEIKEEKVIEIRNPEVEKLQSKIKLLEQKIDYQKNQNQEMNKTISTLIENHNIEKKSLEDQIENLRIENEKNVDFEFEKMQLEIKISQLQDQLDTHVCTVSKTDPTAMDMAIKAMEAELNANREKMKNLEDENIRLNIELNKAKEQYKKDLVSLEELSKQKRKLEKEIETLEDKISEEAEGSQKSKEELQKLKKEIEDLDGDEKKINVRKGNFEKSQKEIMKTLKKLEEEKEKLQKEIKRNQEKMEKMKRNRDEEVMKLKLKLQEEANKQKKKLDKKSKQDEENERFQQQMVSIMKQKSQLESQNKIFQEEKKKWDSQKDELLQQIKQVRDEKYSIARDLERMQKEKEEEFENQRGKALIMQFNEAFQHLMCLLFISEFNEQLFVAELTSIGKMMGKVSSLLGEESQDAIKIVESSKVVMKKGINFKQLQNETNKKDFLKAFLELSQDFDLLKLRQTLDRQLVELIRPGESIRKHPSNERMKLT